MSKRDKNGIFTKMCGKISKRKSAIPATCFEAYTAEIREGVDTASICLSADSNFLYAFIVIFKIENREPPRAEAPAEAQPINPPQGGSTLTGLFSICHQF